MKPEFITLHDLIACITHTNLGVTDDPCIVNCVNITSQLLDKVLEITQLIADRLHRSGAFDYQIIVLQSKWRYSSIEHPGVQLVYDSVIPKSVIYILTVEINGKKCIRFAPSYVELLSAALSGGRIPLEIDHTWAHAKLYNCIV